MMGEERKGCRIGGHPVHAMLVHFPLAFLFAVFPLELLGFLGWPASRPELGWSLAFWSQAAGLAAAVPAAVTGLPDLAALTSRPRASAVANLHMGVMLGAVSCAGFGLFLKGGPEPVGGMAAFVNLGLSLTSLLLLAWGGRLGGELVYRHVAAQEET